MAEKATGSDVIALLTLELRYEHDVVLARQRARQLAALLGLDVQEQTRIATAVSELARNAHEYAGGGQVKFRVVRDVEGPSVFSVRVRDQGPGIADVNAILEGRYVSRTGMGLGILGARRLSDRFHIETTAGKGTTVEIGRTLPRTVRLTATDADRIMSVIAQGPAQSPFEEIQRQNQELLQALEDVRAGRAQVEKLNAELENTNRGVLALYAELDERAQDLKRASEYKSRFLSDISHELRTPLTSVLNLTRLLLDHTDGNLSSEQDYQVSLIRDSVGTVIDLVNELLDLARIEAGRTTLDPTYFTIGQLFAALQAIARPLLTSDQVRLHVDARHADALLFTDEKRLAQIMRNVVSNAVKFTEVGGIYISAELEPNDMVRLQVRDTGIGIAPQHQSTIFEDFVQVDGPIQRRVRGTGLGLQLSRKLAMLLGGRVEIESTEGVGSMFSVILPRTLVVANVDEPAPLPDGEA